MREFAGKVAVVTGAGSGMGKAFAERFAREQMRVVLADVETEALERARDELARAGHEVLAVPTDVSDPEAVRALCDAALAHFGKIHLACNNAGVEGYLDGAIWEAGEKDWRWTIGVNFWSVVYGTQIFVPAMLAHGEEAHLVNTCSMTSVVRASNMYAIAKQAVFALSEATYVHLHERNAPIGVTALCPGIIATRLFQGSRNRPRALVEDLPAERASAGAQTRARMHERLSHGMAPSEVAEILVRAIRNEQLYVLTDHDWDEAIATRNAEVLSGTNPVISR